MAPRTGNRDSQSTLQTTQPLVAPGRSTLGTRAVVASE
jgi:hypothetical protein